MNDWRELESGRELDELILTVTNSNPIWNEKIGCFVVPILGGALTPASPSIDMNFAMLLLDEQYDSNGKRYMWTLENLPSTEADEYYYHCYCDGLDAYGSSIPLTLCRMTLLLIERSFPKFGKT